MDEKDASVRLVLLVDNTDAICTAHRDKALPLQVLFQVVVLNSETSNKMRSNFSRDYFNFFTFYGLLDDSGQERPKGKKNDPPYKAKYN